MAYWIAAIILVLVLLLAGLLVRLVIAGRGVGEARSVILHLSRDRAWEVVRSFPALHAAHTRGRPDLLIEETLLREGDGTDPGSIWRQKGQWRGRRYWADLEVISWEPPHRLAVQLVRDSLGTERRLLSHHCELKLVPEGPAITKLTWRISARIGGVRLPLARLLWPDRVRTRLLDLGLRSVKRAIDGGAREDRAALGDAALIGTFAVPPLGDRASDRRRSPAFTPGGRLQDQA